MEKTEFLDSFCAQAQSLWNSDDRKKVLSRIAYHERQFENWWKFELASHLWDMTRPDDVKIFLEQHNRADILLAASKKIKTYWYPDYNSKFIVPIELKTVGTWWDSPKKALAEPGKKTLASDMNDISSHRRSSTPCALVGLLITEVGNPNGKLEKCCIYSKDLGTQFGLTCIIDQKIDLPDPKPGTSARAIQLFWSNAE